MGYDLSGTEMVDRFRYLDWSTIGGFGNDSTPFEPRHGFDPLVRILSNLLASCPL